jgi:hypothetical protein
LLPAMIGLYLLSFRPSLTSASIVMGIVAFTYVLLPSLRPELQSKQGERYLGVVSAWLVAAGALRWFESRSQTK